MFIVKDMGRISCPNMNFKYKIDILHNKTESSMLAFSKFLLISWLLLSSVFQSVFAANIAGLTGSYVCMTNRNFAPFAASIIGDSSKGSNTLINFNFDTSQMSGIVSVTDNWGQTSPKPTQSNITASGTFTVSAGLISTSYQITYTFTASGFNRAVTNSANFMVANSGNTLFLSMVPNPNSANEPETGVCQKQ